MAAQEYIPWNQRTVEIAGSTYDGSWFNFHDDPTWANVTYQEGLDVIDDFFSGSPIYALQAQDQPRADRASGIDPNSYSYQGLTQASISDGSGSTENILVDQQYLTAPLLGDTQPATQSSLIARYADKESGLVAYELPTYDTLVPGSQQTVQGSFSTNGSNGFDEGATGACQETYMRYSAFEQHAPHDLLAGAASINAPCANNRDKESPGVSGVTSAAQLLQLALPREVREVTDNFIVWNVPASNQCNGTQTPPPRTIQPTFTVPDVSQIQRSAPQTLYHPVIDDASKFCKPCTPGPSPSKTEQDAALKRCGKPLGWRAFGVSTDFSTVGQRTSEQLVRGAFEENSIQPSKEMNSERAATETPSPTAMEELQSFERVLKPPEFDEIPALRRSPNASPEKAITPVSVSRLRNVGSVGRSGGRPRKNGSISVTPFNYPSVRKAPKPYLHGEYPEEEHGGTVEHSGDIMDVDGKAVSTQQGISKEQIGYLPPPQPHQDIEEPTGATNSSLRFGHTEDLKKIMQEESDPPQEELRIADALDFYGPAARSSCASSQHGFMKWTPLAQTPYHPLRSQPPISFSPRGQSISHGGNNVSAGSGQGVGQPGPAAVTHFSGPSSSQFTAAAPWLPSDGSYAMQMQNVMQQLAAYSPQSTASLPSAAPPVLPSHPPWHSPVCSSPIQNAAPQHAQVAGQGHGNFMSPGAQVQHTQQARPYPIYPFTNYGGYAGSPIAPSPSPITPYMTFAPFPDIPNTVTETTTRDYYAGAQPRLENNLPAHDAQSFGPAPPSATPILRSNAFDVQPKRRASSPAEPQPPSKTRNAPSNGRVGLGIAGMPLMASAEVIDAVVAPTSTPNPSPRVPEEEQHYDADESFLSDTKTVTPACELPTRKAAQEIVRREDGGAEVGKTGQGSHLVTAEIPPPSSPLSDVPSSSEDMNASKTAAETNIASSAAIEDIQTSINAAPKGTVASNRGRSRGRGGATKPATAAGTARGQTKRTNDTGTAAVAARPSAKPAPKAKPASIGIPAPATPRGAPKILSPAQVRSGESQRRGWETRRANEAAKKARAADGGEGTAGAEADADTETGEVQTETKAKSKGRGRKKATTARVDQSGADEDQAEEVESATKAPRRSARISEGLSTARNTPDA